MPTSLDHVDESFRGFRVTRVQHVSELQCTVRELVHEESGAQVLHLENDDPENLFCLSFQTRPTASDGVAHILEHTVLCGSEKFPVKDPFFAMTRRSLNTFMNALTGADFTCYPAASQIPKDFYNLLEVYLDAVFHPKLAELSFRQEGHRLEFHDAANSESPLEIKGIVFNEMKGALNSPTARLSEAIGEALLPDLCYGFNSGGDPKVIPKLTYEQLKAFHSTYYHPSRCLFFFYGNMPLVEHLNFIAEHTLEKTNAQPPLSPIPRQPRFKKPVQRTVEFPVSDESEEMAYVALAWLTCHILEQDQLLALSVLDIILMDTDASPLRMAMLKSGLCRQASSNLESEISEIPWVIVARGCKAEDADQLEKLIRDTLETIVREGVPAQLIESAIHQLEFERSEITGDSAPFGLSLFWRSALLKQHGGQPEDGLVIHSLFSRLRQRISADPRYLTGLLRTYVLDNPHQARIIMTPSRELAAKELAEERAHLDQLCAKLSTAEIKTIVSDAADLQHFQREQEQQDLSVLPRLTLSDVPQKARDYPLTSGACGQLQVFHHGCFTNQIVYADLTMELPRFSIEELPYVRLLTRLLSEVGSGGRDYKETLEYIQENTGGVDAALQLNLQATDPETFRPALHIRGKALYRKGDKLFALLKDLATSVDLTDKSRLKEIILRHYTSLESAINSNAMRYAISLSSSGLGSSSRVSSLWHGLEYFRVIRSLAQNFDSQADHLIRQLEALRERLLHLNHMHLVIGCDERYYTSLCDARFYGLAELKGGSFEPWQRDQAPLLIAPEGVQISSPVAFTAKVIPSIGYSHPDAAALGLAAHLMDTKTLHGRIRESGGAYGAGAVHNPMSGHFYFFAYRDPHIANTLKAFDEAVQEILKGKFTDQELEESKLEYVQDLDAPVAPGSRAGLAYSWLRTGKTLAVRQLNRERVLGTFRDQLINAVRQHIVPNVSRGSPISFADAALLKKENSKLQKLGLPPLKLGKV